MGYILSNIVFIETTVIRAGAQRYKFGGELYTHPKFLPVEKFLSKLGSLLTGISTRYVIKEAINSFQYDLANKIKEIPLEYKDAVLNQYISNISQIERIIKIEELWNCRDLKKGRQVKQHYNKVRTWYFSISSEELIISIGDPSLVKKGLEPSDRIILSEACYLRESKELHCLLFATYDRVFIKLEPLIKSNFGIRPQIPENID